MELETARRDVPPGGAADAAVQERVTAGGELDDALLARLDRVVALSARRAEPALHLELLDELRGLVREAEKLRPPPQPSTGEVVERPARRLHGT